MAEDQPTYTKEQQQKFVQKYRDDIYKAYNQHIASKVDGTVVFNVEVPVRFLILVISSVLASTVVFNVDVPVRSLISVISSVFVVIFVVCPLVNVCKFVIAVNPPNGCVSAVDPSVLPGL